MGDLAWLIKMIGIPKDITTGLAAGMVFAIYSYFREKRATVDRVKIMRALSLIIEFQYIHMECHKDMHPEAKLPINDYVKRLIGIGIPVPIQNKDP